jgi:hypothetical protein
MRIIVKYFLCSREYMSAQSTQLATYENHDY